MRKRGKKGTGYADRLEVLAGVKGRRLRSAAERARIAAESLKPGVQVVEIARKYGVTRFQIYDWRRCLQQGKLSLSGNRAPMFAPLMVEDATRTEAEAAAKPSLAQVEIAIGEVVIRTSVEVEQLSRVIRAVRSSR